MRAHPNGSTCAEIRDAQWRGNARSESKVAITPTTRTDVCSTVLVGSLREESMFTSTSDIFQRTENDWPPRKKWQPTLFRLQKWQVVESLTRDFRMRWTPMTRRTNKNNGSLFLVPFFHSVTQWPQGTPTGLPTSAALGDFAARRPMCEVGPTLHSLSNKERRC